MSVCFQGRGERSSGGSFSGAEGREKRALRLSSESAGVALNGEVHSVYEITEAEDYTWYRVEEDIWIPDDGTWMTYTPAGEVEDE